MKRALVLVAATLGACASPSEIPPAETPFVVAKLADANALAALAPTPSAPAALDPAPLRARAPDDDAAIAGIVDLADARIASFVARLRDPAVAARALTTEPLDADRVLAALWVRNAAIAAARAQVDATRRVYEQSDWLVDVETRLRSLGVPSANVRPSMESAPLAYPGAAALRAEMLDREVDMARARLAMAYLDTVTEAMDSYHTAAHHEGEVTIRRAQLALLDRMITATKPRVELGRAPQAELLEVQAERAMAQDLLTHAETSRVAAYRRLDAFLDLPPDTPLVLAEHAHPPDTTPDASALVDLARRTSPEIAMARAEAARFAAAERMARRMANPAAAPGAAAMPGSQMSAAPEAVATPPAWAAELSARRVAAERAVDEAVRSVERMLADETFELAAAQRMYSVATKATEPATRQALDERLRLYENGRGEFADVLASAKRHLDAEHDIVTARHDYAVAEVRLWKVLGTRPGPTNGATK